MELNQSYIRVACDINHFCSFTKELFLILWWTSKFHFCLKSCGGYSAVSAMLLFWFASNLEKFVRNIWTSSWDIGTYCITEPWHEISNNVVCATSKASDQPVRMHSLIRACSCRLNILWVLSSWQTSYGISKLKRWLHRLVWVYTCQNSTLSEIACHGSTRSLAPCLLAIASDNCWWPLQTL